MSWKNLMHLRSITEKEGRIIGISEGGLVTMRDRALQEEQTLIEECNYHKDEVCVGTGVFQGRKCDGIPF